MIDQSEIVSSWIIFITLFSLAGRQVCQGFCSAATLPVLANYAKMLGQNQFAKAQTIKF
jgi:hypothetical protein